MLLMIRATATLCWMMGSNLACGGMPDNPRCITRCGMRLQGIYPSGAIPADWTCAALQHTEDQMLHYFPLAMDLRFRHPAHICSRFQGASIWLYRGASWTDAWERDVGGLAFCAFGEYQVAAPEGTPPWQTTLPHEMAHAIQNCTSPAPIDQGPGADSQHSNWWRDGIFSVIDMVAESHP